jgi:hypothetical protein
VRRRARVPVVRDPSTVSIVRKDDMNRSHTSITVRIAAAIVSVVTTLTLFSTVVSFSDPQRSQLIDAVNNRAMAGLRNSTAAARPEQTRQIRQFASR